MSKLNTDSGFTRAQEFIYNRGFNAGRDEVNPFSPTRNISSSRYGQQVTLINGVGYEIRKYEQV